MERKDIEEKYTWDLSKIYQDPQAFYHDIEVSEQLLDELTSFQGKLTESIETLLRFLSKRDEMSMLVSKAYCFAHLNCDVEPKNQEFAKITISGLKGGHSGIDIVRYRANANKLMARTLESLVENCNIEVAEISGGSKDNAIPSLSEAIVSCSSIENLDVQCKLLQAEFLNEYYNIDDNITITVEKTEKTEVFSDESTTRVLTVMNNIPDGIQFMNLELDMPHTSNNLGVVSTDENGVSMVCAIRSDIPSKKIELYSKIESLTKLANGNTTFRGDYPAWEMKQDSPLRNLCERVYTEQYGEAPVVETVHAGLECGLFAEKVPDFDMVSFGPNLLDIHSPSERAEIPSVERTWEFLLNVLAEIRE